jgi:hypothetical protein
MRTLLAVVVSLGIVASACAGTGKRHGLKLSEIDAETCDPLFDKVCMPKKSAKASTNGLSNQ